jgi:collagen type III alpha
MKRGFHKAAKELVAEADIATDALPPINARQRFLFESVALFLFSHLHIQSDVELCRRRWWSVFWMFFSAKTTGHGPENVMLYFHVSCLFHFTPHHIP